MARILHVDDETDWLDFVHENLEDHHVDSAESAQKAVSLLEANSAYDVALIDLNLKVEGDGGEILDLLLSRYPATRRIIVTGKPPRGRVRRKLIERFDAYEILIKGQFDLPDLRIVVEEAVAQGPSGLPQTLRLNRSALRQRFRDWQRTQGDRLQSQIRVAEEHASDASRVSVQSGQRAQGAVVRARELEAEFKSSCAHLKDRLADIRSVDDLNVALEALDAAEERFGDASLAEED
jgi:DNA-binding NtrC family response regulator